jgi:hypothetical protein
MLSVVSTQPCVQYNGECASSYKLRASAAEVPLLISSAHHIPTNKSVSAGSLTQQIRSFNAVGVY